MKQKEDKIKVSILCSTYNHSRYIQQTLDGFLVQKTNFRFEVLINDDASNDGTAETIKEYAKKNPETIKPNFQKENLYSRGYRGMMVRFLLPKAKGEYIALCEGDDYWTDPHKLQKQVDFLEKNKNYALCFHPVKVIFENNKAKEHIYPAPNKHSKFTTEELLKGNFIQTNSVVYRKQNYKNIAQNIMPGDWYLHLYHAQFGKIGFIDEIMGVYRKHSGGIWWESKEDTEFWRKHANSYLLLYRELDKMYGKNKKYQDIIQTHISNTLRKVMSANSKKLLEEVFDKFKETIIAHIMYQRALADKRLALINKYQKDLKAKDKHIQNIEAKMKAKDTELNVIKTSKAWKVRNILASLIGKKKIQ